MRSKKAFNNTISSLILQLITIFSGFIVPKLIIETYGSGINGLVTSVTQFLGYIAFLEAGMGGVVRAALYKPLSQKDCKAISSIVNTSEKFFRKIAYIFIVYGLFVACIFPYITNNNFDSLFTFLLVIIIGLSTFSQYFFGITYQLLLQADQKMYVVSILQILTVVLNTIFTIILVSLGWNIIVLKIFTTVIFIIRPLILHFYVKKNYTLVIEKETNNDILKQKWDGVGHHIAYFIRNNTDIVIITLFLNVYEVSVYSIYLMVVSGIRNIVTTFSSGIEAAFGNMIATNQEEFLKKIFNIFELVFFMITIILFTSCLILLMPFITIYTKGVSDVNYYRPVLGLLMILTEVAYCFRLPYHSVVIAAGRFKETKKGAFIEAGINIFLSFLLINYFGMTGVVFSTLCATSFRTVQYVYYLKDNILKRSSYAFFKKLFINFLSFFMILIISQKFHYNVNTYGQWLLYAIKTTIFVFITVLSINSLFFYGEMKQILFYFLKKNK